MQSGGRGLRPTVNPRAGELGGVNISGANRIGSTRHVKIPKANNGSYTVKFDSNKGYAGKGGTTRARRSAREKSAEHADPVKAIDHTPAKSNPEAFRQEAARLEAIGGAKSPKNYNKINSPGKKLE